MKSILLLYCAAFLLFSCDEDSGSKAEGTDGGPCYANGTCNEGLVCDNDICRPENTNNVNNGNPGELNGPCLEGDLCNEGLVCHEAICKTDADGDGYHAGLDCDDNDETVYPGSIHECQSDCAYGTRSCNSAGEWTACTADTECECTQAGTTKEVPCGKCGTATVMCTADLVWEFPTECNGQGACYPWQTEEEECGNCNMRSRSCTQECLWEPWGECDGPGVCAPGTVEWSTDDCTPLGFVQQRECNDSCLWEALVECFGDCQFEARTGTVDASGLPSFNDEVCVSAGPFIMGTNKDFPSDNQEHTIGLSPYFIDVYEVTVRRYKA
ncbi:formylglycine-generating enzyme family protein, partial [Myxococcota bacterium]|nr:formylglycine-generating enzyme family protein [Myxococcota bacterium]